MRILVAILLLGGCGRFGFDAIATERGLDSGLDSGLDLGLLGYWPFEEGSGFVTADHSPSNIEGTLMGGVSFVSGKFGRGLAFDGIDGEVVIDDPAGVLDVGTGTFTYSIWVNESMAVAGYQFGWWRGGSSSTYPGYDFEVNAGGAWSAELSDGIQPLANAQLGPAALGSWILLTAVVDRTAQTETTYRDGAMVDTRDISTLGSLSSSNPGTVGGGVSVSYSFHGAVDEVRVYNRALTPDEVAALYVP